MTHLLQRLWETSCFISCLVTAGLCLDAVLPRPGVSAEEIRFYVGGPFIFSLSVEALETFAETGEVTGDMRTYAQFLDTETLDFLRQGLNQPLPLDAQTVSHLAYSALGRDSIFNVGKVVRIHPDINGFYGLRSAVIMAAAEADAEGWTLLDAIRHFPTATIDVQVEDLLRLRQALAIYADYNQAVVEAIQTEAQAEATTQGAIDLATLPDLSQPGPYRFRQETVTVTNPAVRQTSTGLSVNYDFDVVAYIPEGLTEPAPVIIISHGFGDLQESFFFVAEHLASYGFVALLPEHVGSNLGFRQEYLGGRLNTLLSPMEFLNRPQEIIFLIDELERLVSTSPTWAAQLDLDRIGIYGDSLGGSTALALAGAEINHARLAQACDLDELILNFSLYLECQARFLPPRNYTLRDDRIKAVFVTHPLGGFLYGPEGMGQITVPLLMVAGSHDIVAPVATEQIHPFIWLQSEPKYLALLDAGTHFTSKPGRESAADTQDVADEAVNLLIGEHRDIGTRYTKALNIAFWKSTLQDQTAYLPYLTASYGIAASADQPLRLDLIQSLTPDQLEAAFGGPTPIPVIPPAIAELPPPRAESILTEIERTGVLQVALRRDAAPFGFINQDDGWDGYCGDLAIALGNHLSETLDMPFDIQVVELASTLDNRFDLVRDGTVHLECGPNTIRADVPGINFSRQIFVTSAQFLTLQDQADTINPTASLAGSRLGVLVNTTTEAFVETTYPQAERISFTGAEAREEAVQAVVTGQIDAFVGDGILTYGEVMRQNLPLTDLTLRPDIPLTCEFYGLALPDNDPGWKTTVDQFLLSESTQEAFATWFADTLPSLLNDAEYCLNQ